jgi:hypothetical protein
MKNLQFFTLLFFCSFLGFSQNEDDALRYSHLEFGSTARSLSLGGAMGALGGDASSMSFNPAGLGVYRKSEITFSPTVQVNTVKNIHHQTSASKTSSNVNFQNLGLVMSMNPNSGLWEKINFAIGYNKLTNFSSKSITEGINNNSSYLDVYLNQINDGNFDEFGSNLAWNTYLVDYDSSSSKYYHQNENYKQQEQYIVDEVGKYNEAYGSFGANYNNKLYVGATIGFTNLIYEKNATYSETTNPNDTNIVLDRFELNEYLKTEGNGVSLKIGGIYRITDNLRFGLAFHSPTWIGMDDTYYNDIEADYDTFGVYIDTSSVGIFDYKLNTPSRAIASLAYVFGTHGIISVDYEFVDYANNRLKGRRSSEDKVFAEANANIAHKFKIAHNIRVGGELKLDPVIVRAGYAYYGNPLSKNVEVDLTTQYFTGGVGYRKNNFFIDLGISLSSQTTGFLLYNYKNQETTSSKNSQVRVVTTVGFKL